jgi:PKD repeat protein
VQQLHIYGGSLTPDPEPGYRGIYVTAFSESPFLSGEQPPKARFSYSPESPSEGDGVQFLDSSLVESEVTYQWDFGDGTSSTVQNPVHQFISMGTYKVILTITDNEGFSSVRKEYVSISGAEQNELIQVNWTKSFGGHYDVYDAVQSQNGLLIGGNIKNSDYSNFRGWLSALNQTGDQDWSNQYGGDYSNIRHILPTTDGGSILLGEGAWGSNNYSYGMMKIDQSGGEVWYSPLDGGYGQFVGSYPEIRPVCEDLNGGYVLLENSAITGQTNVYVHHFDQSGNFERTKRFFSYRNDFANSIIQGHDGSFFIAGEREGKPFVRKIDSDFSTKTMRFYDSGMSCWNFQIVRSSDNSFIVAGVVSPSTSDMSYSSIWLMKIDEDLNVIWDRFIRFDGETGFFSTGYSWILLEPIEDGGCIVGYSSFNRLNPNQKEMNIEKFNANGNSLWRNSPYLYQENPVIFRSLVQTAPGEFAIAGSDDYVDGPGKIGGVVVKISEITNSDNNLPPIASFSYPISAFINENVQFTDASSDPDGTIVSWSWSFGDTAGSTSINQNPSFQFTDVGTYIVTLIVTDNQGMSGSITHEITVTDQGNQPPTAVFTFTPEYPLTSDIIQFTDLSSDQEGSITSWSWNFGDSTGSISDLQNPTFQYLQPGNYDVSLEVTDGGGLKNKKVMPISVDLVPEFTVSPVNPTNADQIQFTDTTVVNESFITLRSWDFDDNSDPVETTDPAAKTVTHKFTWPGTYRASLTLTGMDAYTYYNRQDIVVASEDNPNVFPVANFTFSPSQPSVGTDISFTDTSTDEDGWVDGYLWDFGDGTEPDTDNYPVHQYATAGTYTVNLTVTDDDGATNSVEKTVTVIGGTSNNPPMADFTYFPSLPESNTWIEFLDKSTDPDGTVVLHHWDFGDGQSLDLPVEGVMHPYADSGTYLVRLEVTDDSGNVANISQSITIFDEHEDQNPVTSFTYTPLSPTTQNIIAFTDTSTDDGTLTRWNWYFGDWYSNYQSDSQNPAHRYSDAGTYQVYLEVFDEHGHRSYAVQDIQVSWPESMTYNCSVPGGSVEGSSITVDTNFAGTNVTVTGDTISWKQNGLVTNITTSGIVEENGVISADITDIQVASEPVTDIISDLGPVEASFDTHLTNLPTDATIMTSIDAECREDAYSAFQLVATGAGMVIQDVAYTLNIQKENLWDGDDVFDATIRMVAPASWVDANGGVENIRIFRYPDSGETQVLVTIATDLGDGNYLFEAFSPNGMSVFGLVGVTIPQKNSPPVLDPIGDKETVEGSALSFTVKATDTDSDALTYAASPLEFGMTFNTTTGIFAWTPAEGQVGSYVVNFSVSDGALTDDEAIAITVTHLNRPPVAEDDTYSLQAGTTFNVPAPGVLANDTDPDGDPLTASLFASVRNGTLTLNPDGSFTYTPVTGWTGTDSFEYKAHDGKLNSRAATVTFVIESGYEPPVAVADSYTVNMDESLAIDAPGVLVNDHKSEGYSLSAIIVENTTHGELALSLDGSFQYKPDSGWSGSDSFRYKASDGTIASEPVTVFITVRFVNRAPVAVPHAYTMNVSTVLEVPAPGVLENNTDPNYDTLTAMISGLPTNGTIILNTDGSFNYTPAIGWVGVDSFFYKAFDGFLESAPARVTITIRKVNHPPVAFPDAYSMNVSETLEILPPGVLANDVDSDDNELKPELVTAPGHGALTLHLNGSFFYTPVKKWTGTDTFTYVAFDGTARSQPATVTITVATKTSDPLSAISDLITDIQNMDLPERTTNSIISKLEAASKSLQKGNKNAAVNQLNAFINEVEAQSGKKFTEAQASTLIASAKEIINAIQV